MFYPPLYKYESLVLQEMFRLFRNCPNVEICVTKFAQMVQIVHQTSHSVKVVNDDNEDECMQYT